MWISCNLKKSENSCRIFGRFSGGFFCENSEISAQNFAAVSLGKGHSCGAQGVWGWRLCHGLFTCMIFCCFCIRAIWFFIFPNFLSSNSKIPNTGISCNIGTSAKNPARICGFSILLFNSMFLYNQNDKYNNRF